MKPTKPVDTTDLPRRDEAPLNLARLPHLRQRYTGRAAPVTTLTPWYPADIKPVRPGWYDTKVRVIVSRAWWGGACWQGGPDNPAPLIFQTREWRGSTTPTADHQPGAESMLPKQPIPPRGWVGIGGRS